MSDVRLNPPDNQPRKQNNRTIFYIILILLLLGINVYLYLKYYQKSNQSQKLTEQVNADSTRLADLDMKFQEALVNIESYKDRMQNSIASLP
jgi:cell division protein FtsL